MIFISSVVIFFLFAVSGKVWIWVSCFFLFIFLFLFKDRSSLKISNMRMWIYLIIFLFLLSFDFKDFSFSGIKIIKSIKILLHFYQFSVIINFANKSVKIKDIYDFFIKRNMIKTAFYLVFITVVFKKLLKDITDVFSYYSSQNNGFYFIVNIPELFYRCIRECVKVSYAVSENFIFRRIYEE